MAADHDADALPTLVELCYAVITQNVDQLSSLGDLSFELAKPILEHCSAEQLDELEGHYSESQKSEYRRTDAEIWKTKCYQLLGPASEDLYTSGERRTPTRWRTEYYALVREHESLADRASSRVRAIREARDLEHPRAVVAERLPWNGGRTGRKNNSNLTPAWRKLVSETRKISTGVFLERHPAAAAPPILLPPPPLPPPLPPLPHYSSPLSTPSLPMRSSRTTQIHPSTTTSRCPISTPQGPFPPAALPPSFLSAPPASAAPSASPSTSTALFVPDRNSLRPPSSSHAGLSRVKSQPLGTPRPNLPTSHTTSRYRPY